MPADLVLTAMQRATKHWEAVCGVTFRYGGITEAPPSTVVSGVRDNLVVVGWNAFGDPTVAAAANLAWSGGVIHDGDIALNSGVALDPVTIRHVLLHETGHLIGLQHSLDSNSVMSSPREHLRKDDIEGCASLYGYSQNSNVERIFNWAEWNFPYFKPSAQITTTATVDWKQYRYRYYPDSRSYMGESEGVLYVLGNQFILTPTITKVGAVADYLPKAIAAGF